MKWFWLIVIIFAPVFDAHAVRCPNLTADRIMNDYDAVFMGRKTAHMYVQQNDEPPHYNLGIFLIEKIWKNTSATGKALPLEIMSETTLAMETIRGFSEDRKNIWWEKEYAERHIVLAKYKPARPLNAVDLWVELCGLREPEKYAAMLDQWVTEQGVQK